VGFKLIFQDKSLDEVAEAYQWYEGQLQGLGEDFIEELENILQKLRHNPQYFGFAFDNIRDARLKRFPYLVVFEIEVDTVYIIAVRNIKRNR